MSRAHGGDIHGFHAPSPLPFRPSLALSTQSCALLCMSLSNTKRNRGARYRESSCGGVTAWPVASGRSHCGKLLSPPRPLPGFAGGQLSPPTSSDCFIIIAYLAQNFGRVFRMIPPGICNLTIWSPIILKLHEHHRTLKRLSE